MRVVFTSEELLEAASQDDNPANSDFVGKVEINSPSYMERAKLPMDIGLGELAELAADKDTKKKLMLETGIEFQVKAAEKIFPYIICVDLKNEKTGEHLKTKEEFSEHPGCEDLFGGLIAKFVNGFLGKKKKPQPKPN